MEFLLGFDNSRPFQGYMKPSVSLNKGIILEVLNFEQSEMIVTVMSKLIFGKNLLSLCMFLCRVFNNAINVFKASCIYILLAFKIL